MNDLQSSWGSFLGLPPVTVLEGEAEVVHQEIPGYMRGCPNQLRQHKVLRGPFARTVILLYYRCGGLRYENKLKRAFQLQLNDD